MRLRSKTALNLLLFPVLGAVLLGGCSGASSSDESETSSNTEEIEFSWWGNDERHTYTMNAVDLFQLEEPDIQVSYRYGVWDGFEKRMRVWMASCDQSDVMQINYSWLSEYSADGDGFYDLYQLTDYIDLSSFSETALKFGEINGKLNAIPIAFNTSTLYYNQELFASYNLELPETWDDFFAAAEVMREDGIYPLGMAQKQLFLFLIAYYEQSTGRPFFSDEGQLLAEPTDIQYLLEFYERLIDEKVLQPVDQFSITKFAKGEFAGSMFWISDADKYCATLADAGATPVIGAYPTMAGESLTGWYMKPATMYAISNITPYPEAAAKLLNFLVNSTEMADYQQTEKGVPVSSMAVQELESKGLLDGYGYEANRKMLENENAMGIMIPIMENEDIIEAFKQDADEYLYEQMSLEECAQRIYTDLQQIIEKLN
jgi:oligogalacturonide transport system substrate-binding protein